MMKQPVEVPIGSHVYKIGQLNAMQQFHVSRRIAPLFAILGVSFGSLIEKGTMSVEDLLPSLAPLSHVLSAMTDEQIDYITATCLAVVQRREMAGQVAKWAPVSTGSQVLYADIDMLEMIRLVVEVMRQNLADFFAELIDQAQSKSSSQTTTPTA